MSLLATIKEKARQQLSELGQDRLKGGYRSLLAEARKLIPPDKSADLVYMAASQALKKLEERQDRFGRLGQLGITALMVELASGDEDEAVRFYLATQAGWDELLTAVGEAREADAQAQRERDAAKAEALDFLRDVGVAAAKAVLPFLIKAALAGAGVA